MDGFFYDSLANKYISLDAVSEESKNDPDYIYALIERYFKLTIKLRFDNYYEREQDDKAVSKYKLFLDYNIGSNLKNNREFFYKVLSNYGEALRFASASIQNDYELVLMAVKNNSHALNYIGKHLKCDKNFIYEATKIGVLAFIFADSSLKNDKEFVSKLFDINPEILSHASLSLRNDKDFIISLMKKNYLALQFASDDLKKDEEFVAYLIKNVHRDSLKFAHIDISTNKKLLFYSLVKSDLFIKLKKRYYEQYIEQVLDGDETKATYSNFFGNILSSMEILKKIYFSYNFTVSDINNLEKYIGIFDEETKMKFKKNTEIAKMSSRNYYINFYNSIVLVKDNREYLMKVYEKYGLNEDNIIKFIINNKYLSPECKKGIIDISCGYFNLNNIVRVKDIFNLLEEMLSRKLTLEQILDEKNIPLKEFYKIYNASKSNNPALYDYIKEALNMNSIRGLQKHFKKGYMVLDFKSTNLDDYYNEFEITDINKFIDEYKGTELYDKLTNKFSPMINQINDLIKK